MSRSPMTSQEMRVYREFLGFTAKQLGHRFGVAERAILRYEHGDRNVPERSANAIRSMLAESTELVAEVVAETAAQDSPIYVLPIATEEHPAGWWRRVAARASLEVPDLRITDVNG